MIEDRLRDLLRDAVAVAAPGVEIPADIELDRPKRKEFGDFSTNLALVLAGSLDRPPRDVAQALVDAMPPAEFVERVEVAGPGFLNLHVTDDWLYDVLRDVLAQGATYGHAEPSGRSVQVEFVSANPTGPLHIGHTRNAVLGDAIARLLHAAGWRVEREYYFNDAGRQMELFGASVEVRYLERFGREGELPEDGYRGAYIADIAADIAAEHGDAFLDLPEPQRRERLLVEGARRMLEQIKGTLERFGIRFDVFFSERTLHDAGEIEEAVRRLTERGYAYEAEGAIFFRSTDFGDEKDRVVIRSNGEPTYFGADCAYIVDKFARGFDHLIYVWGADHHGTVKRLHGAAEALGFDPGEVEIVLYQWVTLLRGGEELSFSKRAGVIVTLDELLDEVGPDAVRFTLLSQSSDSTIAFDIEEVKRRSMENPVFYVQYGHARIASILRTAEAQGIAMRPVDQVDLSLLREEPELDLLKAISEFPALVAAAAELRAPYKLTHYAQDLAARFHRFYTDHRVLSDDPELTQARLWLAEAARRAIANVLDLLGVSAPASMERGDA
ncbi:MAG: arginine--tRNA ligase [Actinomycetota bacterium]